MSKEESSTTKLVLEGPLSFRDLYHEMYDFYIDGDNLTESIKDFAGTGVTTDDGSIKITQYGQATITIELTR